MRNGLQALNRVKKVLLGISILYFYGLAIAFQFELPLHGLDRPVSFLVVGICFLAALLIEVRLTWWTRRRRIAWSVLGILCYALLGLGIAPLLYGDIALWIALFAPPCLIFVIGFLYASGRVVHRAFFSHMKLSLDVVLKELRSMPGWDVLADGLEKTFRFSSYAEATEFLQRALVAAKTVHREPDFTLTRRAVKARVLTPDIGVTQADLDLAKTLDEI
jgi:pterin-4a-carbinolamine dehydratase